MDMIGRIRRLHSRKNKSERESARITGLSRNTVAKWLHGEVDGPPKYGRGEQPNKLTVFHEALKQALKADARRPKHERRTAKALCAEIKVGGYDGGCTRVTDFVRAWRQGKVRCRPQTSLSCRPPSTPARAVAEWWYVDTVASPSNIETFAVAFEAMLGANRLQPSVQTTSRVNPPALAADLPAGEGDDD